MEIFFYLLNELLLARDLTGPLRALQPAPATLVGHSLGGTIAVQYALLHPDEVSALVLVNPVITGRLRPNLHWMYRPAPSRIIADLTRRLWPRLSTHVQQALPANRLRLVPEGHLRRNREDLADFMVRILHENRPDEQDASDLLYTQTDCLDGWPDLETSAARMQAILEKVQDDLA